MSDAADRRFKNIRVYWLAFIVYWGIILFGYDTYILTIVAEGSNGLAEIYAGRVISGVGIGAITAVAPAFVSECAPKEVRGRITGCFQIMVAIGVMISYFINFGVGIHIPTGPPVWRIPFGFQIVPAGILAFGLLTIKESPRYLASVDRRDDAIANLAYLRWEPVTSMSVIEEISEIYAAIEEERQARKNLGWKEAFFGKGNFTRFVISFVIFFLQQWSGPNTINFNVQLLCSANLRSRVVKVVATSIFVFFGVETVGRKIPLFISAMGMGTLFFIIGAILKTHPPPTVISGQPAPSPPPASKAMAGLLYIYACFWAMGWGTLSLPHALIPETKGRSLEEMDVIFGAISADQRKADIEKQRGKLHTPSLNVS
ncbi:hypothetical protein H0H87_005318 [Tephrocybe sp. NHM501043]|nr:hypothetical protein H0H87_005318 [Tephrocybe sp. NHM501043]